jgi:hypothetical protein
MRVRGGCPDARGSIDLAAHNRTTPNRAVVAAGGLMVSMFLTMVDVPVPVRDSILEDIRVREAGVAGRFARPAVG